jgi:hypothetical protein
MFIEIQLNLPKLLFYKNLPPNDTVQTIKQINNSNHIINATYNVYYRKKRTEFILISYDIRWK